MSNTNPTGCGSINTTVYNFTTNDGGKTSGCATGNMPIGTDTGSQVSINGSTDLSKIIVGNNGACVMSIVYQSFTGIARSAELYVFGQGPKGIGSGSLHTSYYTTGQPTDPHTVTLTDSDPSCHNDKFQDNTNITRICWQSD
jgi:hypothetical protein